MLSNSAGVLSMCSLLTKISGMSVCLLHNASFVFTWSQWGKHINLQRCHIFYRQAIHHMNNTVVLFFSVWSFGPWWSSYHFRNCPITHYAFLALMHIVCCPLDITMLCRRSVLWKKQQRDFNFVLRINETSVCVNVEKSLEKCYVMFEKMMPS